LEGVGDRVVPIQAEARSTYGFDRRMGSESASNSRLSRTVVAALQ
jgi:hypothetical protein